MNEDLFFEEELKRRIKNEIIDKATEELFEEKGYTFRNNDYVDDLTKQDVLQEFEEVLFDYYCSEQGYENYEEAIDSNYDIFEDKIDPFVNSLSGENLESMYRRHKFSRLEKSFILYSYFFKKWRGKDYKYQDISLAERCAITDVLLREMLLKSFSKKDIEKIKSILENEKYNSERYLKTKEHFLSLLSDRPFDGINNFEIEEKIEKKTLQEFNDIINCGGYALKIDRYVFPMGDTSDAKAVSTILETFPFVRMLGDSKLEDDEYMVIYRIMKNGHHFVRVDGDGTVREKCGSAFPQVFDKWEKGYDGKEDIIFAVKKDHQMFGYRRDNKEGLDFEETVSQAIRTKNNSFSYHSKYYSLKKNQDGDVVVVSKDGEKVIADVEIDDDECITVVKSGMEQYVENFSGKIKPIIKDGKLINHDEFRRKDKDKEVVYYE